MVDDVWVPCAECGVAVSPAFAHRVPTALVPVGFGLPFAGNGVGVVRICPTCWSRGLPPSPPRVLLQ
jgi:hypothetical protein